MNFELQQILTSAVGFLVFVWIMKKFAWGPVLELLEERRNKIEQEFKGIEQSKADVAALTEEYESKLRDIEAERREKIVQAVNEGKKMAEEIKTKAREEARLMEVKAKADLEQDVAKARVQLKDEMVGITMAAAQTILGEELDEAKHRNVIDRFIDGVEKA